MEEQNKMLADLNAAASSMNSKLDDIHPVVIELHHWRPEMECAVDELHAEINNLRVRVLDSTSLGDPAANVDLSLSRPTSADAPSAAPTSTKLCCLS